MILIIEDDSGINTVFMLYFNLFFKRKVKMLASFQEALAFLKTDPKVDVVLMDYYLGSEPATGLIPHVRALKSQPKLIIMSATSEPETILQETAIEKDSFIRKPFSLDEVCRHIRGHMKSRHRKDRSRCVQSLA